MKKLLHENRELSARLTGYAVAAGAIVALTPTLFGQVQYSGIQNILVDYPGTYNLDMDGDANIDFEFVLDGWAFSTSTFFYELYRGNIVNPVSGTYANSWMVGTSGAMGLSASFTVDSSWTAWSNNTGIGWSGILGMYSTFFGATYTYGNFLGQEKYIGVRFIIGVDQHYGWIRASMTPDARHLTLHDWAYETTPGGGITTDDTWGPVPTLTPGVPARTNIQVASVNVSFDEPAIGLTIDDFSISNGNATGLTTITPGLEYTLEVSAILNGTVQVTLPAGAVTDNSLNDNEESITSWMFDNTGPVITFDTGIPGATNQPTVTLGISFSEEVSGMELGDLVVTNGAAANLTEVAPGLEYTVEVTAIGEGEVIVNLPAGAVTDLAGNDNTPSSISWLYDITAPVVTFDSGIPGATNQPTVTLGISFSEEVSGMELGDLVVTNGAAANLTEVTPNLEYTVEITATAEGEVIVELPSATVSDVAGNDNTAGTVNWDYDLTSPQVTLEQDITGPTNLVTVEVTVQFDEAIEGLTAGDFTVTNGSASNLVEVTVGTVFTIEVTAAADGSVTVELPAATVTDIAGNDNTTGSTSWVYDGTAPSVVFDAGVTGSTTEQTVNVSVSFSEAIEGLTVGDFIATNANVSNLATVTAGTAYTVDVTAVTGGVVSLELPAGSVTDEAGNENAAASVSYTWESGVALDNITDNLISLYPNPVGDHLTIELKQEANITITYMTGQVALIKQNVLNDVIDVSGLSAGIYLIHIETDEGVNIYKFIKE